MSAAAADACRLAIMTSIVFTPLLVVALVLQAAGGGRTLQIGPTGARLTEDDVRQITGIARESGSAAWLLVGQSPSGPRRSPHPWPVAVFLVAEHRTPRLQRGRLLFVRAGLVSLDDYSAAKDWELSSSGQWAQVPTGSTSSSEVRDSRDSNRPFALTGKVDDQTIQDVVATVRRASPRATAVQVAWPIVWMNADSDSKVTVHLVGLNADELSGQAVILEKSATGWTVVTILGWAV